MVLRRQASAQQDKARAAVLGIRGVPSFVFGGRYAVTGAQPVDVLRQVLDKVWAELQPFPAVVAEGATCGPEGC